MTTTLENDIRAAQDSNAHNSKYLTFTLSDGTYGVEILKVREIFGMMDITRVPQTPEFVKGVINLRGRVIPVVDLRLKFGLEKAEFTEETCIVVVDVGSQVGLIVDTVQEVLDIPDADIDPPPPLGLGVQTDFILGMGKVKDEVKTLLNVDRILAPEEMSQTIAAAAAEV